MSFRRVQKSKKCWTVFRSVYSGLQSLRFARLWIHSKEKKTVYCRVPAPVSWPTSRRRVRSVFLFWRRMYPNRTITPRRFEYLEKRKPWGTRIHDLSCRSMPAFCKSYGHQVHWKHSIRMPDGRIRKMTLLGASTIWDPRTFDCGNLVTLGFTMPRGYRHSRLDCATGRAVEA